MHNAPVGKFYTSVDVERSFSRYLQEHIAVHPSRCKFILENLIKDTVAHCFADDEYSDIE